MALETISDGQWRREQGEAQGPPKLSKNVGHKCTRLLFDKVHASALTRPAWPQQWICAHVYASAVLPV